MLVYKCKNYGDFDISGRKSVTAGVVVSNTTESRKKVGRYWVRIWVNVILFVHTLELCKK